MSKKLLSLLVLLILMLNFSACKTNPYSGSYMSEKNSGLSLKLNSNNSFEIVNNFRTDFVYSTGKYEIINNQIKFIFDDSKANPFNTDLTGKIEGSVINIYNLSRDSVTKFIKN